MRTKDQLNRISEIAVLLQYLYMDVEHAIIFNNGLTDLRIHMNDNFDILCANLSFPNIPEIDWSSEMTPHTCLCIIELLKEEKAIEFPNSFENRWEEIKEVTKTNMWLNRPRRSDPNA